MMDINQFQSEILIDTIAGMANFNSHVVTCMTMIAAHESLGCTYVVQNGGGPAKGPYQMETRTHDDVWRNSDNIWNDAFRLKIITQQEYLDNELGNSSCHPHANRMIYDFKYATFMARKRLHMDVNPIPKTLESCAEYCKSFWNAGGKATAQEYYDDYNTWVEAFR